VPGLPCRRHAGRHDRHRGRPDPALQRRPRPRGDTARQLQRLLREQFARQVATLDLAAHPVLVALRDRYQGPETATAETASRSGLAPEELVQSQQTHGDFSDGSVGDDEGGMLTGRADREAHASPDDQLAGAFTLFLTPVTLVS
jgi:hypothetical protein